jgi:citrate lyase beta subunit
MSDPGLGDARNRARGAGRRQAGGGFERFRTRLAGFVFGPNDISRETRIRMQPGRAAMIPMITHCILATRAHGLEILDGPYSDISNIDGFATECAQGRDLGFDGKTLIHPSHIEACNAIFTPPAEEVEQARKIIAAFRKARKTPPRRHPARRADGGAAARRYGAAHDLRLRTRSRRWGH